MQVSEAPWSVLLSWFRARPLRASLRGHHFRVLAPASASSRPVRGAPPERTVAAAYHFSQPVYHFSQPARARVAEARSSYDADLAAAAGTYMTPIQGSNVVAASCGPLPQQLKLGSAVPQMYQSLSPFVLAPKGCAAGLRARPPCALT